MGAGRTQSGPPQGSTPASAPKKAQLVVARGILNIGALPRRCRPQVTRIDTPSALHSRSSMPWRFLPGLDLISLFPLELEIELTQTHMTQKPMQYFRLPRAGFAKVLALENRKTFRG